jgi:hypothetical protein
MTKRKQTHTSEEDIQFLEAHLAGTLKPVAPSKEIVKRLNTRIRMPNRERDTIYLPGWGRLFVVFGGVISGMLLFITLARAFYYLVGRRGTL